MVLNCFIGFIKMLKVMQLRYPSRVRFQISRQKTDTKNKKLLSI